MNSTLFSLNGDQWWKIIKTGLYLLGATLITFLLEKVIPSIQVPTNWIWIMPIINMLLVAAKNFFSNNEGNFGRKDV